MPPIVALRGPDQPMRRPVTRNAGLELKLIPPETMRKLIAQLDQIRVYTPNELISDEDKFSRWFNWFIRYVRVKDNSILGVAQFIGIPIDDLEQAAKVGLLEAAKRFDPAREVLFTTYARFWVFKEIIELIRNEGRYLHIPRNLNCFETAKLAVEFIDKSGLSYPENEFQSLDQTNPDAAKLVRSLCKDEAKLGKIKARVDRTESALANARNVQSIEEILNPWSDRNKISELPDTGHSRKALFNKILVRELLEVLEPREREVILARFYDDKTLGQVGIELGISWEWVRQIEQGALEKLRKHSSRNILFANNGKPRPIKIPRSLSTPEEKRCYLIGEAIPDDIIDNWLSGKQSPPLWFLKEIVPKLKEAGLIEKTTKNMLMLAYQGSSKLSIDELILRIKRKIGPDDTTTHVSKPETSHPIASYA